MTTALKRQDEDTSATGAVVDFGDLGERMGFHLRQAQTAMWRDFAAALAKLELTQRQTAVLELIAGNPAVSQVGLASALGMDRATMMAMIDRLEARGLLERRRSTDDRRRQELHLTAEGQRVTAAASRIIAAHEASYKARFSDEEMTALMGALKRIHGRF